MLYTQEDDTRNRELLKKETIILFLGAIPFVILLTIGFAVRNRWMAMAGVFLACSEMIFTYGMRVGPLSRYQNFLDEIHSGISHDTRGVLIRISEEPVFDHGVYFTEIIINIYKDQAEDGERRFLLDRGKQMPESIKPGDLVTINSQGVYVLGIAHLEV